MQLRAVAVATVIVVAGLTAGAVSAGEWYNVSGGAPPPDVPAPECVWNCSDNSATESSASGGGSAGPFRPPKPARPDMNAVVGGMIMQGVLEAVLNPPQPVRGNIDDVIAAQRQAEALKAQQAAQSKAADSAAFRALQSQVNGYKGSSPGSLALKGVDDELTALAAQVREPFDTPGSELAGETVSGGEAKNPTPFFGDTMPEADLRLLVEPENDPRVVDLREAQSLVVASIKSDADARQLPAETVANPELTREECVALNQKLDRVLIQREKFAKTVDLAASELERWEKQNREALTNFATAGVQHYLGNFQDYLTRRGAAADRLLRIYAKNANTMAKEGVDVTALAAKMQTLKRISTAGQISGLSSQGLEWSGFMKNGLSAMIGQLAADNTALEDMLADPAVEKHFETELPALKAALDLTKIAAGAEVFGKWAARKMPVVAGCELAIDQSYNAFDWALSFKQMISSRDIYGNALDAAKGIQKLITETRLAQSGCQNL